MERGEPHHLRCSAVKLAFPFEAIAGEGLTAERMRLPATFFSRSCFDGSSRTKSPSVTGMKAQVPQGPKLETFPLAYCSFAVSAATRQSNTEEPEASSVSHPARFAKSLYWFVGRVSLYLYCPTE